MAQFIQVDTLTSTFLPVLRDRLLLANFVTRDAGVEAGLHIGKQVLMRRPRKRTALRRDIDSTAAITLRTSLEDTVAIGLEHDVYDARPITDAELTLDIENFGIQVMNPMLDAVVDDLEGRMGTLISGATYPVSSQVGYTRANNTDFAANRAAFTSAVLRARRALNDKFVPDDGRILLLGSDVESDYLGGLTNIAVSTENTSALRDAALPPLFGFRVFHSNVIPANKAYAFHPSAFMAALRAPVVPRGAIAGSSAVQEGIPLTIFHDYDPTITVERLVVRTFYGDEVNTDHDGAMDAAVNSARVFKRAVEITVTNAV